MKYNGSMYAVLGIILSIALMSKGRELPNHFKIDFSKGMTPSLYYNIYKPIFLKNNDWKLAKSSYNAFLHQFTYSETPRIPKVIHQIWLGSPLPDRYKQLQATWIKQHPDWEYKLWTDKDVEAFGLHNKALYDAASNYAEKADVARYEILYRHGGLYVDTDFECIQPFDILHHSLEFYAGITFRKELRINNALIGAAAGHPILKDCIEKMKKKPQGLTNMVSTVTYTGPIHFTAMILNHLKKPYKHCAIFPNTFFYPIAHFQTDIDSYKKLKKWIKPETFAVHYWDVSWVKKRALEIEKGDI